MDTTTITLTVTNLNNSGEGSLRQAIIDANAYTGDLPVSIVVDSSLAGQTLTLSSSFPTLSKACSLDGNGIILSNYNITTSASLNLHNLTLPQLVLSSSGSIAGSNIILTAEEAIRLSNWSGITDFSAVTFSSYGAYVCISGTLGDSTFTALPESLSGGYRIINSTVTIEKGKTVILEEGAQWNFSGKSAYMGSVDAYLNIYGTLEVDNENVSDVFVAENSYSSIYVGSEGKLLLNNANIQDIGSITISDCGELCMTGGILAAQSGVTINSGGKATLEAVEVENSVYNQGELNMQGGSINNYIKNQGTLIMCDVNSASYIEVLGNTELNGVTCSEIVVSSNMLLRTGEKGVTLTGEQAIQLSNYSGNVGDLLEVVKWNATAAGSYVRITGTLGDSTFTALPESLSGGYRIINSTVTIEKGKTVILEEGVQWNFSGKSAYMGSVDAYLNIYGTLEVDNENVSDVFVAANSYSSIYVGSEGKLLLNNANIQNIGRITIADCGELCMTGGILAAQSEVNYNSGGNVILSHVMVKSQINNSGSLELVNSTHTSYVNNKGTMVATGTTFTSYVINSGTLCITDNYFESYLQINGTEGITASGNVFTGTETVRLTDYTGTIAEALAIVSEATAETAYMGVSGKLSTITLEDVSGKLSGGYKLSGDVTIERANTVSLAEGVVINHQGNDIMVYGYLNADYEEVADAFISTSTYTYITVQDGGVVTLKNASVNLSGSYNQLRVYSGGSFNMTGGSLKASSYGISVSSGGALSLSGVEVKSKIENQGSLTLDCCTFTNQAVTISQNATASITNTSGISTLTINSGANVNLVGNDFSATTIKLNNFVEGEIIDLSGNYWGTTDLDAIKAKISGYSDNIVVINDVLEVDPTTAFMYLGNSLPQDQIGRGVTEVTFYFSHEIDASTVSADTLKLVGKEGEVLPLEYLEVEGHNIRVGFAAMLRESNYRLELSSDILDIAGGALQPETVPGKGHDVLKVNLSAPQVSRMEPGGDFTGTLTGITLYFTEALNLSSLKNGVTITGPNGRNLSITSIESLGGTAYRINVAEQTAYGQYTVTVSNTVTNLAGNRLNQNGNSEYGEADDVFVGSFNIADVDLTITGVTVEKGHTAGDNINVAWTGANSTGYELKGSWTDGVYLSKDTVWDIDDIYLGSVEHTGGLAAGEEYRGSLTVTMPSVKAGDYYVLVRTDINGQEAKDKESYEWVQNLAAEAINVSVKSLQIDEVVHGGTVSDDRYDCYVLQQDAGLAVRVNFGDIIAYEALDVYIRYGEAANASNYDVLQKIDGNNTGFRIEASKGTRDVYVMVRRKDGAEVSYTLQVVEAQMEISDVVAHNLNAAQECTFDIMGINLKHGAQVVFVDSEGNEYVPDEVEYMSSERVTVKFGANKLPAGLLKARVSYDDVVAEAESSVKIVNKTGSHLYIYVKHPNSFGYHIASTITISYKNIGYEAMDAPIIFYTMELNNEENAYLTMDGNIVDQGFWTSTDPEGFSSSVSFLATGATGTQLMPTGEIRLSSGENLTVRFSNPPSLRSESMGGGSRISSRDSIIGAWENVSDLYSYYTYDNISSNLSRKIYYTGWQEPWDFSYPDFTLAVGVITSDNEDALDWNEIVPETEGSAWLKEFIVQAMEKRTGTTWGDYVKGLNQMLVNLDKAGVDVSGLSTEDLLSHMMAQAMGKISPVSTLSSYTDMAVQTTGLSLQVSRAYAADMYSHTRSSVFGYGWTHNWDIALDVKDTGDVVLNIAGHSITFQPDYRGGYQCTAGDGYALTKNRNGSYTLKVGKGAGDVVYDFTKQGALTKVTDANGNSITCSYNESGLLAKLTHSNGEWIAYEYMEDGYVAKLISSTGTVTEYSYENGNLVSSIGMLGDTISYSYSDVYEHFLTAITGTTGNQQHFSYGNNGLLEKNWLQAADSTAMRGECSLSYGDDGGITVTDQYGASSTYYYNLSGKIAKAVDVNGNVLRYAYDSAGNLIAQTDQLGNITSYAYDADGNMISVTNALGNTTYYEYNSAGLVTSIIDAKGNAISYTYDTKGQTTGITYADGSKESWAYDRYGNVISWTTRAGKTVDMSYDAKGNLLSKTVEGEGTTTFAYDVFGNMLSSTDSGGTTTWTYDERYRVIKVQYEDGHSVSYSYDANDRMSSMTDDAGHCTLYSYNVWGDLTLVTDADGNTVVSYEYDMGGRLIREIKGNGTATTYSYTLSGDVARIEHLDAQGAVASFCAYEYNELGLRTSMSTEDGTWIYGYDVIGQLVQADFAPVAGSEVPEQHITYEYDAAGNRTRTVVNGVETLYTNNALNQTTSAGDTQYEYDADGNLIRKVDETGVTTYSWSVEGQLMGMTTSTGDVYAYTYNAFGERVSTSVNGKVSTYVYAGSGNGNVVTEYDTEGNGKYYQYGNGLVGFEDALNGEYWYEADALGSVTGITDASGNLVATYAYDPFGVTLSSSGSLENAYSWLGMYGLAVDDSGLTYMRARYYDEQTGTFISADPIGVEGGLNAYAYCSNNGVMFVDPSGNAHIMARPLDFSTGINQDLDNTLKGASAGLMYSPLSGMLDLAGVALSGEHQFIYYDNGEASGFGKGEDGKGTVDFDKNTKLEDLFLPKAVWYIPHDDILREAEKIVKRHPRWNEYDLLRNNCQDYIQEVLKEYEKLCKEKGLDGAKKFPLPGLGSHDPNDMVGPTGYGEENYIAAGQTMPFMVRFENEEDATAPARWIRVFTTLDEAYDLNSFTLDSIYLAGNTITMAEGQDSFNKIVTMTFEGQEVMVDIRINLDYDTRELKAEFMAIDPQSGSMLMDIMTGILYPNNDSGRGDGYFTYTVQLKDDLSTGTVVGNVADIYFDFNEVIPTPELNYTIDADAPGSRMLSAVDSGVGGEVVLTWEGADAEGGSGVAAYYIFVQKDGGEFGLWKTFTAETTTATFAGLQGSEYGFYVLSVDNVGNVEESKTEAEITAIPTTSDETAPDKLTNLYAAAQGSYAVYIWQGVDDPSGVYYVLEYADNADMTDAVQMFTLNPYLAIEGQELGTWYWRVKAVDGVGNESEWSEGQPYLHVFADPGADDKLASATQLVMGTTTVGTTTNVAPVADWVGAGDAVDYYSITVAGDGAYRVAVDTAALETAVQVSVGVLNAQGEFEPQQELLLAPGAALGTLPGVAVEQGQTLYVKVEAVGGEQNSGGFYELSINGTVPSAGSGLATQNNRAEEATESAADGSSTRGWVGAGDACDFYRVEMANAGSLSLALGELESGARVRIYEQREDGTLAQLQSIAVRSGSELDRTLNLTTGSYFVEVASLDNGAGMHNTAYSLTLKKEEEEQQNSSGLNLA